MKINYHAKLVIRDMDSMKAVTYRRMVNWLEKQVKELKKAEKGQYSKIYTATLMK